MTPTSIEEYINIHTNIMVDKLISLSNLKLRLISNIPSFRGIEFFSKEIIAEFTNNTHTDFELWCISFVGTSINKKYIINKSDKYYRASSFASGYYATDHFGPPVYMMMNQNKFFVFGDNLEQVMWCYFVKYFLLLFSISNNSLFLKAAALNIDGKGTLLLGRGNAGKTTFLGALCQSGANFVTNSHAIIQDSNILGIGTCLRIRNNNKWWRENQNINFKKAIIKGEIMADPKDLFLNYQIAPVKLINICILDYRSSNKNCIQKIPSDQAYNYLEQFGLGINVYRLEEDLLDFYGGNYQNFSVQYQNMKNLLNNIIQQSNCYYISSDILEKNNRNKVINLLSQ